MHFSYSLPFLSLALQPLVQALPAVSEIEAPSLDLLPRGHFFDCNGHSVAMIEPVGEGGFGTVYRGRLEVEGEDDRIVAIKEFHHRQTQAKPLEGYAIAEDRFGADQPNLMEIIATCEIGKREYVVSEWLEGKDVDALLAAGTLKSEENLHFVIDQWLGGLAAMHAAGVAHGDVKLENAMCSSELKWCKVVDYDSLSTEEESKSMCGTVAYMSPGSYPQSVILPCLLLRHR
jgi:eukaryotic-like serine/threonine-protein kinase